MAALIQDSELEAELIAKRRESGGDRYDEVWNGVYVMSPIGNDQHQDLTTGIATVLCVVIQWTRRGLVRAGVNVSRSREDWKQDFRVPDVAVFLDGTSAENCDTHWYGGPDFAVEVTSPNDRTRQKLDFYAAIGTRELLIIDRDPWSLELYRLSGGKLRLIGESTLADQSELASESTGVNWSMIPGEDRPQVRITQPGGDEWVV